MERKLSPREAITVESFESQKLLTAVIHEYKAKLV